MHIADLLGVDLLNKGFASSAHMDRAIGHHIAERADCKYSSTSYSLLLHSETIIVLPFSPVQGNGGRFRITLHFRICKKEKAEGK
jgi:hypothetical protein